MITSQLLVEQIQKNIAVPWQSQRSDGFSDGILLPHEGGEEAGMDECARWLTTFVTEVPVKFIPSGDPFWMPAWN